VHNYTQMQHVQGLDKRRLGTHLKHTNTKHTPPVELLATMQCSHAPHQPTLHTHETL
jgi:hypothetical protein